MQNGKGLSSLSIKSIENAAMSVAKCTVSVTRGSDFEPGDFRQPDRPIKKLCERQPDSPMDQSPPRRSGSPPRNSDGSPMNSALNTPSRRHFASPPGSRGNRADAGTVYSDRFIPSRLSTNLEDAFDMMENRESLSKDYVRGDAKHENQAYMSNLLRSELLGQSVVHNTDPRMDGQIGSPARKEGSSSNLFKYRTSQGSASTSSASHHNGGGSLDSNHSTNSNSDFQNSPAGFGVVQSPDRRRSLNSPKKPVRKISKTPYKVLDAPSLQDDYYLNLVDWSHNNVLSVALGSSVYLWSACTSKVTKLCDLGADDTVTSISWATTGSNISVGTNSGKILIWDAAQCKLVREMAGHENRVGTMAWNSTLLASGSRDRNILLQDIRVRGHSSSGSGSGSSSANTSMNTSHGHHNNTSTATAVRGYSSVQYTYGSPSRASTGGVGVGGSASVNRSLMSNLTAAIHPQGSIRRSSEGYLYSPSHSSSHESMSAVSGAGGSMGGEGRRQSSGYHTDSPMLTDSVFGSMLAAGGGGASVSVGGAGTVSGISSTSSSLLDVTTGLYDPPPPIISATHAARRQTTALHPITSPSRTTTTTTATAATDPCVVRELCAHKQEVCGLKWSFDEKMLASGGNDNKLFVWDATHGSGNSGGSAITEPLCSFTDHTAAVKAVAWSPHQHGLLASGGGTADRHIRFWNALTGVPLHKIDTGSQVCNLMWSKNVNELVSTHGYSLNQVIVWKYPSMQKIATLTGHTLRVLYLAMSPDGQSIVTGAGDETLRFWNIFPGPRNKSGFHIGPSALTPNGSDIR